MNLKNYILSALFLLLFNGVVYILSELNLIDSKKVAIENKLNIVSTHYKVLLETQSKVSDTAYALTIENDKIIGILKEAMSATPQRQKELRVEFYQLLQKTYPIFKKEGIFQYHFIFPDNTVFYRAHKPSKFGDNLTGIRKDFEYTNRTKKIFRGFAQGKTAHAFRNVYPLFDKNKRHIGAMEVSFSSDSFQWYLNHISNIHSHFLVNKKIFDSNAWKRDDLILNYLQSAENKEYMLTLTDGHNKQMCVVNNKERLTSYSEEIAYKMSKGEDFGVVLAPYGYFKEIEIACFLPIKNNLQDETLAWIVSYETSPVLVSVIKNTFIVRVVMFIMSLLILYFIVRQIHSKQKLANANLHLDSLSKEQNLLLSLYDKGDSVLFKWRNDSNWSVEYVSNSINKFLGYDKNEFFSHTITYAQSIYKDDLPRVMQEVENGRNKDYFQHKPYRVVTKTNELKWINDDTIVVRDSDGNITHFIGYISDITSQKENEEIKEKQQKQIFEQTKHAQMGEMIGNIAHQWRQPLSLISTSASSILLQKEFGILDSEKEDMMLTTIVQTTKHLSATIDTFRDYLKETKELQEVILQERIHSAIDIVRASLESHYIKIINDIDAIPPIKMNMVAGEFSEVLINLLNNSKDAIVSHGINNPFVKITLEKNENQVIVKVSDNGGGIPESVLPKIFDPYFTTKHQSQGTGLGLYMSKEIIEKHLYGKLEAMNSEIGAVFKITLPL